MLVAFFVRPKTGMDETNRLAVAGGDDQALRIEVDLRKDSMFQQGCRHRLQQPISARWGGSELRNGRS